MSSIVPPPIVANARRNENGVGLARITLCGGSIVQMYHGPMPSESESRCAVASRSRTTKQVWWNATGIAMRHLNVRVGCAISHEHTSDGGSPDRAGRVRQSLRPVLCDGV